MQTNSLVEETTSFPCGLIASHAEMVQRYEPFLGGTYSLWSGGSNQLLQRSHWQRLLNDENALR